MIYSLPGQDFEATVGDASTGLAGTIGVQILDTPGSTVMLARTTAGISENPAGSGIYSVTLAAPAALGVYSVVWDTGGGSPVYTSEDLYVVSTLGTPVSTTAPLGTGFDQIKQSILDHQFAPNQYDIYAGEKLNEAQMYVAGQVNFRALFDVEEYATTAGVASYDLPSDFMRNDSLVDLEGLRELQYLPVADYDLLDTTLQGRPSAYAIDRAELKFYPSPDAVYNLQFRHYRTPGAMISGTSPDLPAPYHHLLESYALSKCYEREHQLDLAQYHWQRFQQDLGKAQAELQTDTNDLNQVEQVAGMWNDGNTFWNSMRFP